MTAVFAGGAHTCVVQNSGVKCFGLNGAGQLGNGATTSSNVPVTVTGLNNATAVADGGSHSCARTSSGGVKSWGLNQEGELGINDATVNSSATPRDVNGLSNGQSEIIAGIQHVCSCATTAVTCWGFNADGQLGNGSTNRSFTPVSVIGL